MKEITKRHFNNLLDKHIQLAKIEFEIMSAFDMLLSRFQDGGKLLICGNGGSAADADHIVGELMKGFLKKRPLSNKLAERINDCDQYQSLANYLQQALPAINLSAHTALTTSICNDLSADMVFAQQIMGYGNSGDMLLGISTSGNSRNVINAAIVAKAKGLITIGLVGVDGGEMNKVFDLLIHAPGNSTAEIQEFHLPIYHTLCAMLEEEILG